MGFISEYKKAVNGEPAGDEYLIADRQLVCPHCGNTRFEQGEAMLNTAGLTFLKLDWANRSATIFECTACGRIEWFV